MPLDLQGWNSASPVFAQLISETRPRRVCEVGTHKGASVAHMAALAPDATFVCVDTWPERAVFDTFLANIHELNLGSRVFPWRLTSLDAAAYARLAKFHFDLIYIDADHSEAAVEADIRAWLPLTPVIFGDDYDAVWPGVIAAVTRVSDELKLPVEVVDAKWIIRHG